MAELQEGQLYRMAAGNSWRSLTPIERFASLLNHFPDDLADALGVSEKSLIFVIRAFESGKSIRVLEQEDYHKGLRRARRRMTDQQRRTVQASQAGRFESPVVKAGPNLLRPERYHVQFREGEQFVESKWLSYRVEYLPFEVIVKTARELFELYMDTEQFNAFRFEYIADGSKYLEECAIQKRQRIRKTFRDSRLQNQFDVSRIILLSTRTFHFPLFEGNPDKFEDDFYDEWRTLVAKGAIRIVNLVWAFFSDLEKEVMPLVRKDFERYKKRRDGKRGSDGKREKARKPRNPPKRPKR